MIVTWCRSLPLAVAISVPLQPRLLYLTIHGEELKKFFLLHLLGNATNKNLASLRRSNLGRIKLASGISLGRALALALALAVKLFGSEAITVSLGQRRGKMRA